ncbi:MAG TPA: hypothetical protein VGM90_40585 [Kofleriaceae bacterium]
MKSAANKNRSVKKKSAAKKKSAVKKKSAAKKSAAKQPAAKRRSPPKTAPPPPHRRILLDSSITDEDFADATVMMGWKLIDEKEPTETTAHELIYRAGKGTAHYVEDTRIMVRYAAAVGPNIAAIVAEIEELLPFVTDDKALAEAETDRDDLQKMVDWLMSATALGEQAGRVRLVTLIEKRLRHASSAIRRAALLAASWLEWTELRATVEGMAKNDAADDAREDARRLADAYRLRDVGKL